jgi:hypothetical protein
LINAENYLKNGQKKNITYLKEIKNKMISIKILLQNQHGRLGKLGLLLGVIG